MRNQPLRCMNLKAQEKPLQLITDMTVVDVGNKPAIFQSFITDKNYSTMKKHILLGVALLSLFAASCSNDDVIDNGTEAPKTNFKSAYTIKDYFYWDAYTYVTNGDGNTFGEGNYGFHTGSAVTLSCASCPTVSQMVAYLKAGVYWDDAEAGDGQLTYSAPKDGTNGSTIEQNLHTGLWVKKKSVIGADFYNETDQRYNTQEHPEVFKKLSEQSAEEIKRIRTGGDYFFLPAAGQYSCGNFRFVGSSGDYWSSSPNGDISAYRLGFSDFYAFVGDDDRGLGCLPMVAE